MENKLVSLRETADFLRANDDFLIIAHKSPDGDTIGCSLSLYYGLTQMGKRAKILCSDEFPEKYSYIYEPYKSSVKDFLEKTVITVDLADTQLFGSITEKYSDKVELCIDHHPSNTFYAKRTFLNAKAAACCENIFELLSFLNVSFDKNICNSLYTGIVTDSGCFKFSNTTSKTHIIAAHLIDMGADYARINKALADTKTRARLSIEKEVINSLEYYFEDRCAVVTITDQMINSSGATEGEMEGLASLPREIEGIEVGITLKQKNNGYKISLRTGEAVDASLICQELGGGGHARAAGCFIEGDSQSAKEILLEKIKPYLS